MSLVWQSPKTTEKLRILYGKCLKIGGDSHASGAPRSEFAILMIAGGNHTAILVRTGSE